MLRQLGIDTIHQLGSLPRDGLATRLGDEVVRRWDQAWGWSEEVLVSFRQPPELVVNIDLEIPATYREAVWRWLQQAIERLEAQLWHRHDGGLNLNRK